MDLDTEPILVSESVSDDYVMAHLCVEDGSLDWSNQADSSQNTWQDVSTPLSDITTERPKEENKDDEVTTVPLPTPTTAQKKDLFRNVVSSWWKPWNYLTGNSEEKKDTTPSSLTTVISTTVLEASSSTKSTSSPASGKHDYVFDTLIRKKSAFINCSKLFFLRALKTDSYVSKPVLHINKHIKNVLAWCTCSPPFYFSPFCFLQLPLDLFSKNCS